MVFYCNHPPCADDSSKFIFRQYSQCHLLMESGNVKLSQVAGGSTAVDLTRKDKYKDSCGTDEDEDVTRRRKSPEEMLEERETGDGEEESSGEERGMGVSDEADQEDCRPGAVICENGRFEDDEEEIEDMFRSSNLIILPFPRQRNCSAQNINATDDTEANEDEVEEGSEEVSNDRESVVEEELGRRSENKDPEEENVNNNKQVKINNRNQVKRKTFQANDLSRQLVDVGRQLSSWRRSLNHCQPSKLRALVQRLVSGSRITTSLFLRLLEKMSDLRPRLLELNLAVHAFAAESVTRWCHW